MDEVIANTEKACGILKELVNTQQCYRLHFEFDMESGCVPKVRYTVNRFCYVEEKDGRNNT